MRVALLVVALPLLVACQEIPQDARKSFAPEAQTRSSAGADAVLAKRAQTQDDYRLLSVVPQK
jgi:hypothetical protein